MIDRLISAWKQSKILSVFIKIENWYFRINCKNSGFTLLTPNCMAGLIYHRLGQQFCSPTIDLNMQNSDFLKFVNNLDYYITQDVIKIDDPDNDYPVGVIRGEIPKDDIRINFIHYSSFEDAREKWNRRKERINKNNLYVIICDIDDIYQTDFTKTGYLSEEDIKSFEKIVCNNKVVLTRNKNRNYPCFKYIKPDYNRINPLVYMNRDIIGLNGFEKRFDFVSFLNSNCYE